VSQNTEQDVNKMNKTNLNWKKVWFDDKSGYWYSAKVPIIGWEYIVDTHYDLGTDCGFIGGLYFSKLDDDITKISKKFYKTEETAMIACEKHLINTAEKFSNWINYGQK
jgi:hypothetical protein